MAIYDVHGNVIPITTSVSKDSRTILHQGYHVGCDGNSKTAFIQAYTHGFTYVEGDVDVTSDSIMVMSHDSVANITYEDWYAGNNDRITFDEFLAIVKALNLNVVLDGKSGVAGSGQNQAVYDKVKKQGLLDKFVFFGTCSGMDSIDPNVKFAGGPAALTTTWIDNNAREGLIINTNYVNITPEVAQYAVNKGYTLWLYTLGTSGNFLNCYDRIPHVDMWTTDNLSVDAILANRYVE